MKKLSKKGYKKDSPDKNNPYNVIPGNSITMQDVQFPVTGVSMNTGEIKHMQPGNDYYFPNTDQVLEYPMFMQMGGPTQYTPEQWNKMNLNKGLMASPGSSVNLSGKQNSKYMEFYDPKMFIPSNTNARTSSEITWSKINDPNWKYTDQSNSPFISYNAPSQQTVPPKKYVQPSNERVATGFQPNYTTYKYNDGSTKYQDNKGNLYNNTEELQGYLEGLVKKQMGGPLDKFVGNYAKKQLNLSQAPQGQSMDDFLTNKGVDFIDYITSNTKKVLANKEIDEFKKFQMGGGMDFYSGPFGPYTSQQNPNYVDSFVQSNSYDPYQQSGQEQPQTDYFRRNNNIADLGMAGAQVLNKFFNTQQANIQNKKNMNQITIDKTAQLQYGNRGDYDINQGNFRPNQYVAPSYKKGGEYSIKESDLGALLSQGYEFEIID